MEVVITGIGLQSCLGNLSQSWELLLQGKTGIKSYQIFPEFAPLPFGIIGEKPAKLANLTTTIITSALEDAQLIPPLFDCGIVIGSSRGCQSDWEDLMLHKSSDNWLDYLPHQAAIAAARQIGSTAMVLAPNSACATGILAVARGFELIKNGQCQRAIAGAVETPITRLSIAGFQQMGALAKTGCYPFDIHREGLVLGEGGAVFVLESADLARQRQAPIYGKILGFGLTCDAYHISTPNPQLTTALKGIKNCLKNSNLEPKEIDYIHAHGTSTRLNDQTEAALIQSLFSPTIPISSTKGSTGHTLGASGALGIAFSLMAIRDQILPPCVGLKESEFNLNLIKQATVNRINKALVFAFGFGGNNAAIAVSN